MCELLRKRLLRFTVLGLDRVLDGTRDGVVDTQDGTLHQVDLSRSEAAEGARATAGLGSGFFGGRSGIVDVTRLGFLIRGRREDRRAGVVQRVPTEGVGGHGGVLEGTAIVAGWVALQQGLLLFLVLVAVVRLLLLGLGTADGRNGRWTMTEHSRCGWEKHVRSNCSHSLGENDSRSYVLAYPS